MTTPGNELAAILSAIALALGCAKLGNSSDNDWKTFSFGPLTFSAPPDVAPTGEQGIDSAATAWEGDGVRISIDAGPFADRLTGHQNQPNHQARQETIDGQSVRVVEFDQPDGGRFVGAHFPSPKMLTFGVVAQQRTDPELARKVLRSIRFRKP